MKKLATVALCAGTALSIPAPAHAAVRVPTVVAYAPQVASVGEPGRVFDSPNPEPKPYEPEPTYAPEPTYEPTYEPEVKPYEPEPTYGPEPIYAPETQCDKAKLKYKKKQGKGKVMYYCKRLNKHGKKH